MTSSITGSAMDRFVAGLPIEVGAGQSADPTADYDVLWRWSVTHPARFWRALWDFFDLDGVAVTALAEGDDAVLPDATMPGAQWFPGVELNYVDQILRHARTHADPARAAIVGIDERGGRTEITWADLPGQIGAVAQALRGAGVGRGDVVAAYLPDVAEAMVAFLATASIGAVWSGCGADYAPDGAAARVGQLTPRVLYLGNGYQYNGKWIDKRSHGVELIAALTDLTAVVVVESADGPGFDRDTNAGPTLLAHHDLVAAPVDPVVDAVPFDHPLWVLFSSGTTGRPKGIVHGHGGVVLEHLKVAGLHSDLGTDDVFFWQTALSWMMWNYRLAGLLCGATTICYTGSPLFPDADRLWALLEREGVTYFGTSPGQLQASRKADLSPGSDHDLSRLRSLGSTGSTLAADLFVWVAEHVGAHVPVSSVSGGTDVVTAFAGGSVGIPVVPGELSVRYLGVALHSWSPDRRELIDEVGEMVITAPMPSMPVGFWRDEDGSRYRAAYFEHDWTQGRDPGVWRHGDWVTITDRGSMVIHGRSDATLNRHGIRMGSADIYEVVEAVPEIAEAFVVGVDGPDGAYWMPLFVTLVSGATLDDDLRARIASDVRRRLSPRHVPDEVVLAPGIPHTRTGKKLEVPVTGILAGRADVALDPRSVDDPTVIDWYREQGAAHRW
ncbi:acetoacetate--CoA ligase [Williamsia phyllosphaerae]|uniref:Acetoacetyl-CoA synthetase n=1 Tax=Williamsia phyllosphaerae TaxID=885042 RepID=A0ABQ1V1J7_9NOCA|nr:putative acetoacetyl-CoA synthetase [Williamsia phyllosphaerae]